MGSEKDNPIYTHEQVGIAEFTQTPVPFLLKVSYVLLPILGLIAMYVYWDGSHGFLDRGRWEELQQFSNTTVKKDKLPKPYVYEKGK